MQQATARVSQCWMKASRAYLACACARSWVFFFYPRRVAAPMRLRDFVFATARMRSRTNKTFMFMSLHPIRQQ